MEMVISKPFDQICKSQLEPVWNQLGSKPKQLLADIKTLRLLLYYLTQYDCITFYKMLNCLKSHEKELGRSSGWIFLDAANELFTFARLRVYGTNLHKPQTKSDLMNNRLFYSKEFAPRIIKESPKLKALTEVLQEIGTEENLQNEINILITANDDRTCSQIKHFLSKNHLTISKANDQNSEEIDSFDILADQNNDTEDKEEEFIVKMILKPSLNTGNQYIDRPQNSKVKKILKGDKKDLRKKDSSEVSLTQMMRKKKITEQMNSAVDIEENSSSDSESGSIQDQPATSSNNTNNYQNTNIFLSPYSGGAKQRISLIKLLNEIKPKYVILFDCELRFVRQLEVYKVINYELPLRVYFFMYSNSCEEQRYLTSIRREKEAFEILIKEKAVTFFLTFRGDSSF